MSQGFRCDKQISKIANFKRNYLKKLISPLTTLSVTLDFLIIDFSNLQQLKALRNAAESISFGDIVDKKIRSTGHWSLLTTQV